GLVRGKLGGPCEGREPSPPPLPWRLTCSSAGWRFALPALFFVDLCGLRPSSMGYLSRPSGPEAPGTCPQNLSPKRSLSTRRRRLCRGLVMDVVSASPHTVAGIDGGGGRTLLGAANGPGQDPAART